MSGARRAITRDCGVLAACDSEMLGAAVPSSYYEIRVSGLLPAEALLDFDRLTASVEPVETVLHGPIRDQAALNGLLARLAAFGVQVLEIRRLHAQQDPPSPDDRGLPRRSRNARGMGPRPVLRSARLPRWRKRGEKNHPWRV